MYPSPALRTNFREPAPLDGVVCEMWENDTLTPLWETCSFLGHDLSGKSYHPCSGNYTKIEPVDLVEKLLLTEVRKQRY